MISFIHLSDIHYKKNIHPEQGCVIKAFLEDLKKQIQELPPEAYLVITGDLVQTGNDDNYSEFKKDIIDKIHDECRIPYERMIFVPGNHDVDRTHVSQNRIELQGFRDPSNEQIFNNYVNKHDFINTALGKKFKPFDKFYSQITQNYNIDAYVRDIGNNVTILCINTALCSFGGDNNINDNGDTKILNINTRKVEEWIGREENKDKLKIILMHHPIEYLSEWAAIELRRTLKAHPNILILTGHTHEQDLENELIASTNIIYSKAPQLFCEDKMNMLGYSIVMIDDTHKEVLYIKYRKWSNNRRIFICGEDFADNGIRMITQTVKPNTSISCFSGKDKNGEGRQCCSFSKSDNFDYKETAMELLNNPSLITDNYIYVIRSLEKLKLAANTAPDYIFDFLCEYIRQRTRIEQTKMYTEEIKWLSLDNDTKVIKLQPYDVQLALNMLYKDCATDFEHIDKEIDFEKLSFQNISFTGLTVRNTKFSMSFIQHASMFNIKDLNLETFFVNCQFDNSFLDASNMSQSHFECCSFTNSNMRWVNLYGATMNNCCFNGCNMTGVILSELHTHATTFEGCNLDGSEILRINSEDMTFFNNCTFCFASVFSNSLNLNEHIECLNCNWDGAEIDMRYYKNHGRIKRLLIYQKNISTKNIIRNDLDTVRENDTYWKRQRYFSILKTFKDYSLPNGVFDEDKEIKMFVRGNYMNIL